MLRRHVLRGWGVDNENYWKDWWVLFLRLRYGSTNDYRYVCGIYASSSKAKHISYIKLHNVHMYKAKAKCIFLVLVYSGYSENNNPTTKQLCTLIIYSDNYRIHQEIVFIVLHGMHYSRRLDTVPIVHGWPLNIRNFTIVQKDYWKKKKWSISSPFVNRNRERQRYWDAASRVQEWTLRDICYVGVFWYFFDNSCGCSCLVCSTMRRFSGALTHLGCHIVKRNDSGSNRERVAGMCHSGFLYDLTRWSSRSWSFGSGITLLQVPIEKYDQTERRE